MKTANKKNRCVNNNTKNSIKKLLVEAVNYQEKNQPEQANFLYQKVLQQAPENIHALNGLGIIALNAGMLVLASEFFNAAHVTNPHHATVNKNLAMVYSKLSDYEKAIQHYGYVLDTSKNNGEIHAELARLYMQLDNTKQALQHYRSAFELNPNDPGNFQGMVKLDAHSVTTEDINIVEKCLLKPDMPLEVRCSFYFSLGAVYDVSEKYDEAFANYAVANISKVAAFDANKHIEYISGLIQVFSADLFEQKKTFVVNNSSQPVFIVGMPQSGISSVDRLLANHNEIYAAGELDLIEDIAEKLSLTSTDKLIELMSVTDINDELLSDFSKSYLSQVNAMALNNNCKIPRHIIDRKPTNFLYLGLISLLFPKARIIHCVANPLDICLSNYFKNFSADNRYSYDQKNIALYYQQYERLMAHWNKVLPIDIHTVNYDDMVNTPDKTSRQLFGFIDLTWQAEYIGDLSTSRKIDEKNSMQCKYNLYKSPIKHWRKYKKYAHALINELTIPGVTEATTKAVNAP